MIDEESVIIFSQKNESRSFPDSISKTVISSKNCHITNKNFIVKLTACLEDSSFILVQLGERRVERYFASFSGGTCEQSVHNDQHSLI